MIRRNVLLALVAVVTGDTGDEREITRLLRRLQNSLQAGAPADLLGLVDADKFPEYGRFADTIRRLLEEDTVRAYFRQLKDPSRENGRLELFLDGEMEISRNNAAGQVRRRRAQLRISLEGAKNRLKIVELQPRGFFDPL